MKPILFFVFFSLVLFHNLSGQEHPTHPQLIIQQPDGAKPWTNLNINDKPGQFQFAIVTDRTGGHRPGVFEDGVRKLNLLQPEFVMSVGDLIEGYTTDTTEINRQWDEFCGFVAQLQMPFFFVPGNHDLTNPVMENIWKKRFGPTHYSFVYEDVLFMALNSEDQTRGAGRGSISQPQLEWVSKTLVDHPDVKWTFLFMHQPLWAQQTDPVNWFDVERLLSTRKHTVFVGHRHNYVRYERNNSNYYMLATTGGSSPLRGPQFGEFDHFVWVTMTDHGPILANLQLEGVFDDNLHNEEIAAFTEKLWTSDMIRVEPLYVAGPSFKQDSVKFRLTNPFDVPVKVKMSAGFSWDIKTDIPIPELTLEPNSVNFVTMDLEARKPKSIESLKAVKVKAELAVQSEGKTDFFVPFEFNVAPLRRYELVKARNSPRVDGKSNDWKEMPYTLPTSEGATFGITYDDQYVYLGVQVNDSDVIASAKLPAIDQDFIGFVLNGQPFAKSVADKGEGWFASSIYFITSAADELGQTSVRDMSDEEKKLSWKCVRNKSGLFFEAAIPISYIQQQQGLDWQTVRLNIVVQDKDSNGSSERITWQPNWREAANVPGSGMFFRNHSKAKHTSTEGTGK
jgi:hypothetical protein